MGVSRNDATIEPDHLGSTPMDGGVNQHLKRMPLWWRSIWIVGMVMLLPRIPLRLVLMVLLMVVTMVLSLMIPMLWRFSMMRLTVLMRVSMTSV